MNTQTMTQEEVRKKGIKALHKELGPVGMMRFMQQFETGHGDYTKERHEILDNMDIDTIVKDIKKHRKT